MDKYFIGNTPDTILCLLGSLITIGYIILRITIKDQKVFFLNLSNFKGKYSDHIKYILIVIIIMAFAYRAKIITLEMNLWGWIYWTLYLVSFIADLLFLAYLKRKESLQSHF
jgi:hypothetical protein